MLGGATMSVWEASVGVETQAARLRRGEPEAFEEVLRQYQHRLYRYLVRMARDPAVADDLFQQTWLRVVERIKQYDPERNFEAWLFSVARNLAMDHFRRYKPESLDEPQCDELSAATRADFLTAEGPSALDAILAKESATQLGEAMNVLPWIYREVLTLRFEEEMKLEEIAVTLDIPLSTAKTRLRRGLDQIRVVMCGATERKQ
jgi:RNA polymerase sigma-70 factor (ECF subfamily)